MGLGEALPTKGGADSGKTYAEWQEEQVGQVAPALAPADQEDVTVIWRPASPLRAE